MGVFLPAGTKIYDEDGSLVATAKRDLLDGELIALDQFDWPAEPPSETDAIHPAILRTAGLID